MSKSNRILDDGGAWHDEFKDSAYIFIGGLPYEASEGDIITIFSQYGEVIDMRFKRDAKTGKSKGFGFLAYVDQRSTVLAVDNFNGIKLAGRTLRVTHMKDYKPPYEKDKDGNKIVDLSFNAAPEAIEYSSPARVENENELDDEALMIKNGIDPEDPMALHMLKKLKKSSKKKKEKKKKSKKHEDSYKDKSSPRRDSRARSRSLTNSPKTKDTKRTLIENIDSSRSYRKRSITPEAKERSPRRYSRERDRVSHRHIRKISRSPNFRDRSPSRRTRYRSSSEEENRSSRRERYTSRSPQPKKNSQDRRSRYVSSSEEEYRSRRHNRRS